MRKNILIIGGAGYIGSHTSLLLFKHGYNPIILDCFLHDQKIEFPYATVVKGDFADFSILNEIFSVYEIDTVMHFAALIEVGVSVLKPHLFYENNVVKTLQLLDFLLKKKVRHFIFSSSCAVYGIPQKLPLSEEHIFSPISPYGKGKLVIEYALQDYVNAFNLNVATLRYFNVAGGWPEYGLKEQHKPETHVIPLLLEALLKRKPFVIFGDDYATSDGSAIRDYIHVRDIAEAHIKAMLFLHSNTKPGFNSFNLGSGTGFSVKELVAEAEKVTQRKVILKVEKRREGDPPVLIADYRKAEQMLSWKPKHSSLSEILQSAYQSLFQPKKFLKRRLASFKFFF